MLKVSETPEGVSLTVHIQPRAAKNELTGTREEALRLRLTAPPVEGAANRACVEFLAEWLGVKKGQVTIVSGEKSRTKIVQIAGMTRQRVLDKLETVGRQE